MSDILEIIQDFKKECKCGRVHDTTVQDVRIASGLVHHVGEILSENGFCKNLLLVADHNTQKAANGILESLSDFSVTQHIYTDLRVATMELVEEIESLICGKEIAVLSVGSGSLNDICRLASARQNKQFCIFATAPSMDGFASYSAPIVANGFKSSYDAKSPEVIIGDTKILASAPKVLKSAGFGDMIAKYVGLIDWKISTLLTGEYYCEKIAELTKSAVDELMEMADRVTVEDEYTAGKIFEALLKTGIGMSFAQNSRPASGCEHIVAHLIDCLELQEGKIPNFHGDDVGVSTLEVMKIYHRLAEYEQIDTKKEQVDWEAVYAVYGEMAEDVKKLNHPENIVDLVDIRDLKEKWGEIRKIIKSFPGYEVCREAMEKAGCKITVSDIGKKQEFFDLCMKYSPFMRKRLTLLRMMDMISKGMFKNVPTV